MFSANSMTSGGMRPHLVTLQRPWTRDYVFGEVHDVRRDADHVLQDAPHVTQVDDKDLQEANNVPHNYFHFKFSNAKRTSEAIIKNIESKLDKSQSQLTKSTPHVVNVASKESKLGKSEIKTLQRPFIERRHCSRRRLPTSPRRSPTSGGMPAISCRMRPTSRRWTTKTCRRPVRVRSAC
jgi:hypothetical protein